MSGRSRLVRRDIAAARRVACFCRRAPKFPNRLNEKPSINLAGETGCEVASLDLLSKGDTMRQSFCRLSVPLLGMAAVAAPAWADTPPPSMTFMSVPAVADAGPAQPELAWSRNGPTMIVVTRSQAQCGQRASAGSFQISEGTLRLGYSLPVVPAGERNCVATQIFTLKNLPGTDLQVAHEARTEPIMVAQTPAQTSTPLMTFTSVPAATVGDLDQGWRYQQRDRDRIVVIAREPAECGRRPVEPRIEVLDGKVSVGYSLPITLTADVVKDCASTAIITLSNVPNGTTDEISLDTQLKPAPGTEELPTEPSVSMSFMSVPAFATSDPSEQRIFHHKVSDKAVVIVRDRANCGERPAAPSFTYREGLLELSYALPATGIGSSGEAPCASAAIFTFHNLAAGELRVAANATRGESRSVWLRVDTKEAAAAPIVQAMSR